LLNAGYQTEASAWREWMLRAVAGTPQQVNIMYGIHGERRLLETELDWLPGYENSRPVHVGNAAHEQRQLDIFGELMDTLHLARRRGIHQETDAWNLQKNLLKYVAENWNEPDEGIWEVRCGPQDFVHSKVMAWVAVTRTIQSSEKFGLQGDVKQWRELQARIHREVCEKGFNKEINSFTQRYGSKNVDASLLRLPLVGFLPTRDPRILGTVKRVEEELLEDGFVLRYRVESTPDGLHGKEGAFLACSFWLVDAYALLGELEKAKAMFERLLGLANDVGLLSEEYDTKRKRLVGNFPQAFSHIGLINSAFNLHNHHGPAVDRSKLCPDCE
jgi:GH15 family glucan-1,4-alpha-glucosidase